MLFYYIPVYKVLITHHKDYENMLISSLIIGLNFAPKCSYWSYNLTFSYYVRQNKSFVLCNC